MYRHVSTIDMACLSDLPLDIIGEIVDNLQDDLPALKAVALTCPSLLLLCRKYIFRTIMLSPRSRSMRSFASLLDSNPRIVDYVRNLVYLHAPDSLRIIGDLDCTTFLYKFYRIQSLELTGNVTVKWSKLKPRLQESLSRIIHSVTQLNISKIDEFPISIFIPCINLIELELDLIDSMVDDINSYEHEYCAPDAVPQLQSLTLNSNLVRPCRPDRLTTLVNARRSEHVPVLDFSNLRTLTVRICHDSDRVAVHALMKIIKKLEALSYQYRCMHLIYLCFIRCN